MLIREDLEVFLLYSCFILVGTFIRVGSQNDVKLAFWKRGEKKQNLTVLEMERLYLRYCFSLVDNIFTNVEKRRYQLF